MATNPTHPNCLTDEEVLAVQVGDEIEHSGDWYPIQKIDGFGESVCGWPICHFYAFNPEAPFVRISSHLFNGTPRRRYRKAALAQAAE